MLVINTLHRKVFNDNDSSLNFIKIANEYDFYVFNIHNYYH